LRKESLGREIISIAFPTMISGLTDSILNLLTIIFISKTASEYIGVVSLASYLMMIVASITTIFMIGLLVVLSQSYGADRKDLLNQYFNEAFTLSIAVSLMIFLISYQLIDHYIRSMIKDQAISIDVVRSYMIWRLIGSPAMFINSVIATAYRSIGRAWPSAIYSLVNISIALTGLGSIDYYVKDVYQKISLIGLVISASQYISLTTYLFIKSPFIFRPALPSRRILIILGLGLPATLERFVSSIGQNIYLNAVSRGGIQALNAHSIGINVESIIISPSFSIGIASSAVVGHAVGANNVEKAEALLRESVKIGVLWMSIAAAILIGISPFIGHVFTRENETVRLVMFYLIFAALSEPGLGISQAYYGAFRGMGSTYLPLLISIFSVLMLRALPAQILSLYYGAVGAWFTQITDMYGRSLMSYVIYKILRRRIVIKVV